VSVCLSVCLSVSAIRNLNDRILPESTTPLSVEMAQRLPVSHPRQSVPHLPSPSPPINSLTGSPCDSPRSQDSVDTFYFPQPPRHLPAPSPREDLWGSSYRTQHQHISSHSELVGYTLLVSCLPPTATALDLASIFGPFGTLSNLDLQMAVSPDGRLFCGGTAFLHFYGPLHLRDSALSCLNGALVFPFHPPIGVSLVLT
jgi:hypothetical protein